MNLYVDEARPDDTGDGLSWATAKKTLGAAYTLAAPADTINMAAGTYTPGALVLGKAGLTIQGPNAAINPVTNLAGRVPEAVLQAATLTMDANDIQILGLKWDGTDASVKACLRGSNGFGPVNGGVVRNNIMAAGSGVMQYGVFMSVIGTTNNWLVEQNVVGPWTVAAGTAIWLNTSTRSTGCVIRNNRVNGGAAASSRGINVGDFHENVLVEGNAVTTSYWNISCPNKARDVIIRGNTVSGVLVSGTAAIRISADASGEARNITVEDNVISSTQKQGIYVYNNGGYVSGSIIIRNNTISWDPANLIALLGAIEVHIYGLATGSPTANVTISGNTVNFISGYTGAVATSYGITLSGDKVTAALVTGNTVNGGGFVSTEAVAPKPSGLFLVSNIVPDGLLSGAISASGNIFVHLDNGIVAFNAVGLAYGGLSGCTVVAGNHQLTATSYGVRSGAGVVIDARNNFWGDDSGPSGGAIDPVTMLPANGTGVLVSSYVRFDPFMQLNSGRLTEPTYRNPDAATEPGGGVPMTGTPGTDGELAFQTAYNEGGIDIFVDGKKREMSKGGIGNTPELGRKTSVVRNWRDNPGKFDDNVGKR